MTLRTRVGVFLFFSLVTALPACSSSCSSCFACDPIPTCQPLVFPDSGFVPPDVALPWFDVGLDARDVGRIDAPRSCGEPGTVGATCDLGGTCDPAWECFAGGPELLPTVRRDGSPGRDVELPSLSLCTVDCDPTADGVCGPCGRCAPPAGIGEPLCLQACDPWAPDRGGCDEGFACDRASMACVLACFVDRSGFDSCQLTYEIDDTAPGGIATYDEGPDHPFRCNPTTRLCESIGRPDASAGDDCLDRFDCEDGGECVRSDSSDPITTLSDGYCIRRGCNEGELACREDDVCAHTVFDLSEGACMQRCDVGAESSDTQRLGRMGGNPQCDLNEACFWADARGLTTLSSGACWPGNYNDETVYDVGSTCRSDADCFSPFGLGRCLFVDDDSGLLSSAIGMCAITGCGLASDGLPGLRAGDLVISVPDPASMCRTEALGGRDACVAFTPTTTHCIAGCDDATECPEGYACTPLGDSRLCWPACTTDADCRDGARCHASSGGPCDPGTDLCTCDDRVPPDDASVSRPDAGSPEDAAADDAGVVASEDAA